MIFILSILLIVFFVVVGLVVRTKTNNYTFELKKNVTVNLNEEIDPMKYISKMNNVIVYVDNNVDTSTIGEKEISYRIVSSSKKEKTIKYLINVVDNIAPVLEHKDKLSFEEGSKVDLLKYVKASDNYDKDLEVSISGEVNFNKPGTYEVYYVTKDSSNNETKSKLVIDITKKKEIVAPTISEKNNNVVPDSSFTTSKGFSGKVVNGITYIDGVLIANKTYKLPSTYNPGLRTETQQAFNQMASAASAVGINLYIGSGFRSYDTQTKLYNRYAARDGSAQADLYSARPGSSEHQTGLGIDICERNTKACINSDFNNTAAAKWLSNNASTYGFILRYPSGKTDETGYLYESWHFRYVGKDLATKLYNDGNWITLENYFGITSKY